MTAHEKPSSEEQRAREAAISAWWGCMLLVIRQAKQLGLEEQVYDGLDWGSDA